MNRMKRVGLILGIAGLLLPVGCGKPEADKQPRINGPVDPNDKPEGRGAPSGGATPPAGRGGVTPSGGINKN
jgi:hypothetical protein